jgi:hypothetical protein
MGVAVSTYGRNQQMHTLFRSEKLKGKDLLKDLRVDRGIILELILK